MLQNIIRELNTLKEAMLLVTPEESEEPLYFHIQDSGKGGYTYSYFDRNGCEFDGGTYHTKSTVLMGDAVMQILEKESDRNYHAVQILQPQVSSDEEDIQINDKRNDSEN